MKKFIESKSKLALEITITSFAATLILAGIVGATTIGTNISTDGTLAVSSGSTLATTTISGGNLTVGTDTFFVDSNNNYVGIGTTSPAYKLDVYGNSRIDGAMKIGAYTLPSTDGSTSQVLKTDGSGNLTWQNDISTGGGVGAWQIISDGIYNATTTDTVLIGAAAIANGANSLEVTGLSYFSGNVGIGTTSPYAKLSVAGPAVAEYFTATSSTGNSDFAGTGTFKSYIELGTTDTNSRNQIWNYMPSSVLRLGAWSSDGDTGKNVASEGVVIYGKNTNGDDMDNGMGGYARIKHDRFGLYNQKIASLDNYYFRVDPTSLYLRKDDAVKSFEVARATGNLMTLGTIGIGSTTPSAMLGIGSDVSATSTVDFGKMCWRVTAPDASTQVYIYYNAVTGALATTSVSCY
ncbi:MAG: hypothetical protein PHQ42_04135 [Patescibacteria group bacterium]|nr:hypothetical protein [Patescibacteria group bacterium]